MDTGEQYSEALARLIEPGGPFELRSQLTARGPIRTFARSAGSVRELLVDAAARRGSRVFLVQGDERVTYQQFAESAWGVAASLTDDFGMRAGDRVAVLGPNSIGWLTTIFGATAAGAIGVGLNHTWTTEELIFALRDSGARFLIVDTTCVEPLVAAIAQAALPIEAIFVLGGDPPPGCVSAEMLAASGDIPTHVIEADDPFVILYSSGTSARPKGCVTTHLGTVTQLKGMILAGLLAKELSSPAAPSVEAGVPRRREPASLLTGPLFHVAGLHAAVGGSLVTGMKLVLTEAARFDPVEVLGLIEREAITVWGAVPTIIRRVFDHPDVEDYDLSSLESVSIGGAAVPPVLLERVRQVVGSTPRLGNGWGLTETHGGVSLNAGRDLAQHTGSVGRAHAYLDVRVLDEERRERPSGQPGELAVRGPTVFAGYWGRPNDTAAAIRDGWFHTGDVGYIDEAGFIYLIDRASDLIIRGGENISSVEVEEALFAHPGVVEAAVVGVPDPDLGERVVAIVRLSDGEAIDADELRAFVRERVARYKVPASIHFVSEALPTNAAGKVMKRALRDLLVGGGRP